MLQIQERRENYMNIRSEAEPLSAHDSHFWGHLKAELWRTTQSRHSTAPIVCDFLKLWASLEQNHTVAGAECILFLRDLVLGLGDPFQVLRKWLEGTVNALSSVNEESVRNTNCKWTWACSKSLESLWHYGLTYSSIMTPLCRKKWKQQNVISTSPPHPRLLIKELKKISILPMTIGLGWPLYQIKS